MGRFLELVGMAEFPYISCNFRKDGELVFDPEKTYTVGGNNFLLLKNGGGFTMFKDANVINQGAMIDNDALIDYIVEDLGGTIGEEYADLYGQGRITVTDGE